MMSTPASRSPRSMALAEDVPTFTPAADPMRRAALVAGLAFLEGAQMGRLDRAGLFAWFEELLAPLDIEPPTIVHEGGTGHVALTQPRRGESKVLDAMIVQVVEIARAKVVSAVRSLLSPEPIEDFLALAVSSGRVDQGPALSSGRHRGVSWVPTPTGEERLSSIVLSLFAADVLNHREQWALDSRICSDCGRVSFDRAAPSSCRCEADGTLWPSAAQGGPSHVDCARREAARAVRARLVRT